MDLLAIRKREGLTQNQVAEKIGISESGYCLFETGKRIPRPEIAIALGKVLHFDWTEFYEVKESNDAVSDN